jgi:hypothetical protein
MGKVTAFLLAVVVINAAAAGASKTNARVMNAARVATPPVIDGVLEDVWFTSAPARDFGQYRPSLGATPYAATEVYVLYDDLNLYVGWICREPEPARLVASATVRDMFLNDDDSIDLLLDATNSRRDCYDFMVNCRGTRYDGTVTQDGEGSGAEWDAYWEARTSVGADAWYCEMAIPWTSFRYDRKASSFGVNFLRFRKPVYEESYWVCVGTNPNRVSAFGRMEGLENLPSPKPFKLTPYASARAEDVRPTAAYPLLEPTDGWAFEPRGGFDFEYRPGSNVNAMATVLPDYAYIEADPAEINLQPTEIYLTEKRPFFTENFNLFTLPLNLVYTRRLTEIAGGVKGSGRAGPVTVGAVDAVLKNDDPRFPGDNFALVRADVDLKGGHTLGVGGVGRRDLGDQLQPGDTYYGGGEAAYNNVAEAQGRFALPGGFFFTGYGARSATAGDEGDGYLYGAFFSYPGLTDYFQLAYYELAADFRADMSFLQPENLGKRTVEGYGQHEVQVNAVDFRSVTPAVYGTYSRDIFGDTVLWAADPQLRVVTRNDFYASGEFYAGVDRRYLSYGLPEFRNSYVGLEAGRAPAAWGGGDVSYLQGTYYGDYYHNYAAGLSFIPWPVWVLDADTTVYNPRGGERFYVANFKSTLNVTEDVFWRVIALGDSDARTGAASTLWGWEFRPGRTAYLAYEQRRDANGHFVLADQLVFLKISYMITA